MENCRPSTSVRVDGPTDYARRPRQRYSVLYLWPPYGIGQAIIFSSCGFFYLSSSLCRPTYKICGHYIFALWFFLLSSFFLSSPNLSGRRLDACHTCTHGVALVRIYDAGLKRTARGSLKIHDAKWLKNSPSAHHRTTLLGYIFATKAFIDNRKKTC